MTDRNTPTIRPHAPTDRYAQRPRRPARPWQDVAALQRQAQHRLDVQAAYRGARLLHEAQARAGGAR